MNTHTRAGDATAASNTPELPPTMTVADAGRLLGISRSSAYDAVARGEIPVLRLGRRLLVPTAHLLDMLGMREARFRVDAADEDAKQGSSG